MANVERVFTIEGMTCEHCEVTVSEEVSELDGVSEVQADRSTGRVVVRGDAVDDTVVKTAIAEAGYTVVE